MYWLADVYLHPSPLLSPLLTPVSTSFKLIQPSASSLCAPMAGSDILLPRSFRAPGVRRWQLEKLIDAAFISYLASRAS